MSLVSIIVPVYNAAPYLRSCLDSLLAQTLEDIEIICVNDGSSDASPQILDEYANRDHRIRVIHQENAGVSAARNAGLQAAYGAYVGFVDSDDRVDALLFEAALREMQRDSILDIVCWGHTVEERADVSHLVRRHPFNHDRIKDFFGKRKLTDNLKCALLGPVWGKLFRMEKIRQYDIVFPDEIGIHEDTVFLCKYLAWADHAFFMEYYGYYYRDTPGSILNRIRKNRKKVDTVFIPMFSEIDNYYRRFSIGEKKMILGKILVVCLDHALRFSSDYDAFIVEAKRFVSQYDLPIGEIPELRKMFSGKFYFRREESLSFWEKICSVKNIINKKVFRILCWEFAVERKLR